MIMKCVKFLFGPSFIHSNLIFVVLGEMGRTLKHVWCKVLRCIFYSYLSLNSVWLRPSSQDKDAYNFLLGGPNIDYDKISTSEGFAKHFYSLTKRTDIIFGDMICVAKYRLERALFSIFTCADSPFPHKSKYPYG